ncbi:MAG: hypothetical protein KDB00_14325 [Planctomycetales bacterium]|nr:hypothetical protein [Planctomycetales bacterium]
MSLLELSAALAVVLIIAAIAVPRVLGMREKGRVSACDALFVALDGEIANALDSLTIPPTTVIGQVILAHQDADNPRNRSELAYVHDDSSLANVGIPNYISSPAQQHACQVLLTGPAIVGDLEVRLFQPPTAPDEGGGERSIRIGVD